MEIPAAVVFWRKLHVDLRIRVTTGGRWKVPAGIANLQ